MEDFPEFILASRSPRRRELLRREGYRFRVVAPPLAEPAAPPSTGAVPAAEALAYFKARSVQVDHPDAVVLGADTVVTCRGRTFGKAADEAAARRMLAALSGTRHEVTTALALLLPGCAAGPPEAPARLLAAETTHITMRGLTAGEIDRYVASGEWRDKAGAYAIQETGDAFIERVDGSLSNVIGLPLELLERMLRRAGRPAGRVGE